MKKIYLLATLLPACLSSFADGSTFHLAARQTNWRWRNNNGSETTATWKAAQNTATTYNGKGVIRLRIEIVNLSTTTCGSDGCQTAPNNNITLDDTLQYSTTPSDASSWKNIGFDTSKAFVIRGAGNQLRQNQVTTAQLVDSAYSFIRGKVMVSDTILENVTISTGRRSELEWSLRGTAHLLANTTYYFRHHRTNFLYGCFCSYYAYPQGYPSLTTPAKVSASALEDDLSVPALTVISNKVSLSVVPNPAHSGIGFRLSGTAGETVHAVLTDAIGRVIHQQTFANAQPDALYKLSLAQQPAAGLYILKVTGNGLSESSKVMVQ